ERGGRVWGRGWGGLGGGGAVGGRVGWGGGGGGVRGAATRESARWSEWPWKATRRTPESVVSRVKRSADGGAERLDLMGAKMRVSGSSGSGATSSTERAAPAKAMEPPPR